MLDPGLGCAQSHRAAASHSDLPAGAEERPFEALAVPCPLWAVLSSLSVVSLLASSLDLVSVDVREQFVAPLSSPVIFRDSCFMELQ